MAGGLRGWFEVRPGERGPVGLAAATFFLILFSYMLIRPVREAMGVEREFDDLYWLWFFTLGGMVVANLLYAFLASRVGVRLLATVAYGVFACTLLVFIVVLAMDPTRTGRAMFALPGWVVGAAGAQPITLGHVFYVWLSVFNLFVISLFWAQAAGTFTLEQSKRLFPIVAAGGTVGAVAGSFTATLIAREVAPALMMGLSLVLLVGAVVAGRLAFVGQGRFIEANDVRTPDPGESSGEGPDSCGARPGWSSQRGGGSGVPSRGANGAPTEPRVDVVAGLRNIISSRYMLGISGWVACLAIGSSLLYFTQAEIVRDRGRDLAERIALFAQIDLLTQGVTLVLQLAVTAGLMRSLGVGRLLLAGPLVLVVGYAALWAAPVYATIALFQACFRAAERGVARPARETLFTVVPREQKYVTKPFLDTFVYRGGDVLGLLVHRGLFVAGAGLAAAAGVGLGLAAAWGVLGLWLGKEQGRRASGGRGEDRT